MAYWRMQLHPNEAGEAMWYAVQSLAAGYIGLDFSSDDVGDLHRTDKNELPTHQKDYWAFAHNMALDDEVLIVVHHFPFALVTIDGDYNYIRTPDPKIGVWFRHFRHVTKLRFYADFCKNAHEWERLPMIDTISPLVEVSTKSYRLIQEWSEQVPVG